MNIDDTRDALLVNLARGMAELLFEAARPESSTERIRILKLSGALKGQADLLERDMNDKRRR